MITQEDLQKLLKYDSETGWFIWLISNSNRVQVGARAGFLHQASGYRYITINGKKYLESRLAHFYMTGNWPKEEIDHKNRIKSENKWNNLREATRIQNLVNKSKTERKYDLPTGVYKSGNKFTVYQQINKKRYYLGTFNTPNEAHQKYISHLQQHGFDSFIP